MTHSIKKILFAAAGFMLAMNAAAFAGEKTAAEASAIVSKDQARQIAVRHVKNGRIVDERFHDRWFKDDDYEFIIVDETNRYRILVDAKTGTATQAKSREIFTDFLSEGDRNLLAMKKIALIAPPNVREIAMKRAPNAIITRMERYLKHDNVTYAVEMGGTPDTNLHVEMMIDGKTGDILLYEETQYGHG